MGRFQHEAVAIDPATGWVYLTEDRMPAGFYRFRPTVAGQLAKGGTLEALAIQGQHGYQTATNQPLMIARRVKWVRIDQPDSDAPTLELGFVFNQGFAKGRPLSPDWRAAGTVTTASNSTPRSAGTRRRGRSGSITRAATSCDSYSSHPQPPS